MAIPFTEDDVVAAYRRHPECRPGIGEYFGRKRNGVTPCCPLAILCVDKEPNYFRKDDLSALVVANMLGISSAKEVVEFTIGTDLLSIGSPHPARDLGFRVVVRLAREGMLSPQLTKRVLALSDPE